MINTAEPPTMRLQLALNVENLDEAVEFYTKMFATEPARLRPGYANFAIANPPLKLVLFETGEAGTINHLGVETSTAAEVSDAEIRLTAEGLETTGVEDSICCYATKTETWLNGPDNTRWEWYVRTGDSEQLENTSLGQSGQVCAELGCAPEPQPAAEPVPDTAPGAEAGSCCGAQPVAAGDVPAEAATAASCC